MNVDSAQPRSTKNLEQNQFANYIQVEMLANEFYVLTLERWIPCFNGKSNPGDSSLATNFDSLEEELELQYAPLGYALEPDFHGLVIPSGEKVLT